MQTWLNRWRRARRQRRSRTVFMVMAAAVLGGLFGAVAEYLLDPARGHARRAELRERSAAAGRRSAKQVRRTAVRRAAHLRGRAHRMGHRLTTPYHPPVDDRTLVDRVRSEVFGHRRFGRLSVNVDAFDGVVTLRGQLEDQNTIHDLEVAVGKVTGVRRVENLLHTPHTTAPNLTALQRSEQ
jgi:osmotically-inducible protein OsmY